MPGRWRLPAQRGYYKRPPLMDFTPNMARSIISTSNAPAAIGTYSQAVRAGDTLYISGQIGLDPQTGQLVDGIESQIDRVFRNLEAVAEAAGGSLADSVKLTVYLTDLSHFARVNEIMARYFDKPYPARAAPWSRRMRSSCSAVESPSLRAKSRDGRQASFGRRGDAVALNTRLSTLNPAVQAKLARLGIHRDLDLPARLARAGGRHGALDRDRVPAAAPADLADRGSDGRDRASLLQLLCEPGEGARPRRDGARLRRGSHGIFRRRDDPSALLRAARCGAAAERADADLSDHRGPCAGAAAAPDRKRARARFAR